nr:sigma-70 family RNA polymerase sigma factor [Acanthopleuribacter pedis]
MSDRLYRYAYRLTSNDKDAEDLVQDTLLRAYNKFEQYQSGTSPLAWMLVILRSIFINKYRKKKREGHQVSFEDMAAGVDRLLVEDTRDLPENPEDFLFRNVLDGELRDALANLPKHYLEVILLVDMEDLSYRDAAEVLQIPPGTVMSRLHRARKTLQGELQELARKKGIIKGKVANLVPPRKDQKSVGGAQYGS